MPDPGQLLPAALVVLMVAVLLWFAFGTQANIRRGNRLLAWLQDGLPVLGPRTTLRWLGSSVAELRIVDPVTPFRKAAVLVVLEPRDLGLLWAVARSRGRRDFVVLRLDLVRAPALRADVVDPQAWTAADARTDEPPPDGRTAWTDASGTPLEIRHEAGADLDALRERWSRLAAVSGRPWRMSVRQTVPHLEIHLLPGEPEARPGSRPLMEVVRQLAKELSASR
jgi:hypothetical protein